MPVVDVSNRWLRCLGIGILALALLSCSPRVAHWGNLPDPDKLAQIKPGRDTRDDVAAILGSPSSVGVFDQESWYYISERTETVAFFAPDVSERHVIIIRFDKNGVVKKIDNLGLEQGNLVEPVDRETPTAGTEMSILRQLLGNLGRFNKPKDAPPKQ